MRVLIAILSTCVFGASASAMECHLRSGPIREAALPLALPVGSTEPVSLQDAAVQTDCSKAPQSSPLSRPRPVLPAGMRRIVRFAKDEASPPSSRIAGASLALALLTAVSLGSPAKAAEPESPWGLPVVGAPTGCSKAVSPVMTVQGRSATIRGADGRLCEFRITASTRPENRSERIVLSTPLNKPLLLGRSPMLVILTYHAEDREGWAKGRMAAQVNNGALLFDRLGSDGSTGEIRVPLSPGAILTAGRLDVTLYLQAEAQPGGSALLALDAVTIQGE